MILFYGLGYKHVSKKKKKSLAKIFNLSKSLKCLHSSAKLKQREIKYKIHSMYLILREYLSAYACAYPRMQNSALELFSAQNEVFLSPIRLSIYTNYIKHRLKNRHFETFSPFFHTAPFLYGLYLSYMFRYFNSNLITTFVWLMFN